MVPWSSPSSTTRKSTVLTPVALVVVLLLAGLAAAGLDESVDPSPQASSSDPFEYLEPPEDLISAGEDPLVRLSLPQEDGSLLEVQSPYPVTMLQGLDGVPEHSAMELPPEVLGRIDPALLDIVDITKRGLLDEQDRIGMILEIPLLKDTTSLPLELYELINGTLTDVRLHSMGFLSARASLSDLPHVAMLPGVEKVHLNDALEVLLVQSVPLIGADQVHDQQDSSGAAVIGQGIKIAILDSGIDHTHSDLGGCFGPDCKVVGGWDYINDHGTPMDDHGHGTHVAAIAAGAQGVAPGASLLDYKVCDHAGACPTSHVLAAIDQAVTDGAHVISMSIGGPGTTQSPTAQAVDWAVDQGVVVVSAAGNAGPDPMSITAPGTALRGITVGATDKTDNIAAFSSRGPVTAPSQEAVGLKPDLLAPGVDIIAAVPTGSCNMCDPTGYRAASGTSMATPHIAGTAALLLQAHPQWTPDDVKGALMGSAEELQQDIRAEGTGRVDAWAAYQARLSILPGNLFLGMTGSPSESITIEKSFTVKNLDSTPLTVDLSSTASGFGTSLSPDQLTLAPGAQETVTLSATVPSGIPWGWYDGRVGAQAGTHDAHMRMGLWVAEVIHFDLGENVWITALYQRTRSLGWTIAQSQFSLFLPSDTYHVHVRYLGCSYSPCSSANVILGPIEHEGVTWVNATVDDAEHPLIHMPKRADGTPFDMNTTFLASHFRIAHLENAFQYVSFTGGSPAPMHFNLVGDHWTIGHGAVVRLPGEVYMVGNSTRGVEGTVMWRTNPDDYDAFDLRYTLPREFTSSNLWPYCVFQTEPYGGPGAAGRRSITQDAVETYHFTITDNRTLVYPWSGDHQVPAAPCTMTHSDLELNTNAGGPCQDPGNCFFIPGVNWIFDDDGVLNQVSRSSSANPRVMDIRYAKTDNTLAQADGPAALGGRLETGQEQVTLRQTGGWFFLTASGHRNLETRYDERPMAWRVQQDGETLDSGRYTSGSSMFRTDLDGEGIVRTTTHTSGAQLAGATCSVRHEATYDPSNTPGTVPSIDWTRVHGDGSFGSRFPPDTPVTLYFAVGDHDNLSALAVSAHATNGQDELVFDDLLPQGDVYTLDMGIPSEGAWRLRITVLTPHNQTITLHQEPSFFIGAGGCGDMRPMALAGVSAWMADPGENITFSAASSYDPAKGNLTYEWSQDGQPLGTGPEFTTSFQEGRHCMDLNVTNGAGLSDQDTICVIISPAPVAVATVSPIRANLGETFTFDGTASYSEVSDIVAHEWSQDDAVVSTDPVHTRSFTTPGENCLTLSVIDENGRTGTTDACVEVNHPPTAVASAQPTRVNAGDPVTFDATGSFDQDGTITAYEWRYGDQTVSTQATHTHSFDQTGQDHCLLLIVTDDEGATGTDTACTYLNEPPTAVAVVSPRAGLQGQNATFDATDSFDTDGTIAAYSWTLDDEVVSNESVHHMSFDELGEHCLELIVTDDDGAKDTVEACLDVVEPPVAVAAASPGRANIDDPIEFNGTASYSDHGSIIAYEWSLNGTAVSPEAVHIRSFPAPGDHCLSLRVMDDNDFSDTTEVCIEINHPPVAVATADPHRVNAAQDVTFDGSQSMDEDGTVVAYEWRHQGETVSTQATHFMGFTETGQDHCLELVVTDNDGALDTDIACVYVNEPPVAVAEAPGTAVIHDDVPFDATGSHDSDGEITGYQWTHQGTVVSEESVLSYSFASTGTQCLDLVVTDDDGAIGTDEACVEIVEPPAPLAVATASPSPVNPDMAVTFDGSDSQARDDPFDRGISYLWELEGQTVSTQAVHTRSFSTYGTHCLVLTVTNPWGESDSATACVEVTNDYQISATPTQEAYLPNQQPRIDIRVRDLGGNTVGGASVHAEGRYETGAESVDQILESLGCPTTWSASGTTFQNGFVRIDAPGIPARCAGITTHMELVTGVDGRWVVEISAEKDGNEGTATTAYRIGL
jgi:subtilisin family serine protease